MNKIRTTITIDKELLKIVHHHNIKVSTFLDNSLRDYLSKINGSKSLIKNNNDLTECGCRDLNPSYKLGKLK